MNLEDKLKDPQNNLSIPLQNINVSKLNDLKTVIPNVKVVVCPELQTNGLMIFPFYKPISRTFIYGE